MEEFQQHIYNTFKEKFSNNPILVAAPGRINLIGEHTDYNNGFVLPASIDKTITYALAKNGLPTKCRIFSVDQQERFSFETSALTALNGGWQNYIIGVVAKLQEISGKQLSGFDAIFGGNIPIGAGLSSSAALECGLAYGLNQLFNLRLSRWEIIKLCQKAEHEYVGVQCGIMDQFASVMGRRDGALRLDCLSLEYEVFPLELGDYQLLLCNTNVHHSLSGSEYNRRRAECWEGVQAVQKRHPEVQSMRQVTAAYLQEIEADVSPIILRRCRYILKENQRVLDASAALQQQDLQKLGELLYESHAGMQYEYEISCPELDFLVDATRDKDYILGARMVGGGFGGCTLNIIRQDKIQEFLSEISPAYKTFAGLTMTSYLVTLGEGVHVVQ